MISKQLVTFFYCSKLKAEMLEFSEKVVYLTEINAFYSCDAALVNKVEPFNGYFGGSMLFGALNLGLYEKATPCSDGHRNDSQLFCAGDKNRLCKQHKSYSNLLFTVNP